MFQFPQLPREINQLVHEFKVQAEINDAFNLHKKKSRIIFVHIRSCKNDFQVSERFNLRHVEDHPADLCKLLGRYFHKSFRLKYTPTPHRPSDWKYRFDIFPELHFHGYN